MKEKSLLRKFVEEVDGWLSLEVAELLFRLAKKAPAGHIVEIGSWKGKSTLCLALGAREIVHAIDPHNGSKEHAEDTDTYPDFLKNLDHYGLKEKVHPYKMSSQKAVENWQAPISLLWIDGSHEYQDVYNDFHLWRPHLINGAWVAFHDSKWPGVRRVLWEELFTDPHFSIIRRVEDTTYARFHSIPSKITNKINILLLHREKFKQALKRRRRKLRQLTKSHLSEILSSF